MNHVARHFSVVSRPALAAAVGFLPFGIATGLAQEPPRPPREVPYLNYPPGTVVPGIPAGPSSAASPAPANPTAPGSLDALKQREQELATIRAEQKKALDTEARLKREIDSIGDDRHKLN